MTTKVAPDAAFSNRAFALGRPPCTSTAQSPSSCSTLSAAAAGQAVTPARTSQETGYEKGDVQHVAGQ